MSRSELVTSLLVLEGYPTLRCVDGDIITNGNWYFSVEMAGRCDDRPAMDECVCGDKWGDISYRIYRHRTPRSTDVYKMLAVLAGGTWVEVMAPT